MPVAGGAPTLYRILVSPSWQRPRADLYGFGLQQTLPEIMIPLKPEDESIAIALQPVFDGVYDRDRYQARIDYPQSPPAPALPEADQTWSTGHLQSQGVI